MFIFATSPASPRASCLPFIAYITDALLLTYLHSSLYFPLSFFARPSLFFTCTSPSTPILILPLLSVPGTFVSISTTTSHLSSPYRSVLLSHRCYFLYLFSWIISVSRLVQSTSLSVYTFSISSDFFFHWLLSV